MNTFEMTLLYDYYGELLTERQRMCFELRHGQDLSLAEIAEELQVSRQGVHDNLTRAEALLRNMEEKTGCVKRDLAYRKTLQTIRQKAMRLSECADSEVSVLAKEILSAADMLEE